MTETKLKIPIKEARVYWNSETGKVVVGTIKHPATRDRYYDLWICMNGITMDYTKANQTEAICDLFAVLLWWWENDMIDLKCALREIRKIEGVSEWLDFKKYWS